MAYTTYAEIVILTGTTYPQATIEGIITKADAIVDGWLADFNAVGTAHAMLASASADVAKAILLERMAFDNSKPNSLTIGEFSASDNTDRKIETLMARAKETVKNWVTKNYNTTGDADFCDPQKRADSKMGQMNLSQRPVYQYHSDADEDNATDPGDYA
jgi:hypothetical protein